MNITLLTTMTWIERPQGIAPRKRRKNYRERYRKHDQTSSSLPCSAQDQGPIVRAVTEGPSNSGQISSVTSFKPSSIAEIFDRVFVNYVTT